MHIRSGFGDAPRGLLVSKDGLWAGVEPVGSSAVTRTGCQVSHATYSPCLKRSCGHIPGKSKCWWPFITSVTMRALTSWDTPLPPPVSYKGRDVTSSADWFTIPRKCSVFELVILALLPVLSNFYGYDCYHFDCDYYCFTSF